MTTTLVTGGTGYVGTLALQALRDADTCALVSLDVRPPARPVEGVTYVTDDVRSDTLPDLLAAHDVAAVVHLAAIVDPPPGMSERTLHDIEVGGTERVLHACAENAVAHVTVTSSGAAYGYHVSNVGRLLTEDDPIRGHPEFAYSKHKAEVERLLARYRRLHPELAQLVLRPGTILGEGTDNRITALFEQRAVVGLRGADVPFVFVWDHDVAAVISRGVTERIEGIFNLAGQGTLTLREIAAIEGKPFVPLPVGAIRGTLRLLDRLGVAPYGSEQVDFLRYRPVLDNTALTRRFDGLPSRTTRETYEIYRRGRDARRAQEAAGG